MCFTLKLVHSKQLLYFSNFYRWMFIYHRKKAVKEKNGSIKENVLAAHFWVLMALHLTFFTTNLPLSCFFFFFFRGRWFSDRNTQQLLPSQETGPLALCVERFLSSCSGLFLFASATAFCSPHSDALPSPNLLTSFPSQFDVYFPVPPVTNC